MFAPLVLLFIALPIAELFVILQVGGAIGVGNTLGVLILISIVGATLARSQGRATWRRFNEALAAGRMPAREVFDGAMVILAGALLLTPGFITDGVGVLLLLPPVRAVLRRFTAKRVAVATPGAPIFVWQRTRSPAGRPPAADWEGTAQELHDERELPEGER